MNAGPPVDVSSIAPQRRRIKRWLAIAAAILVVPLAGLAVLWFAFPPEVLREHVRMVRGPDAKFTAEEGPAPRSGLDFQAQAGKLEANDIFASSCASSAGDHARLACRTLAVLNRSEHLFMLRLGEQLVENCKKLPYVDRIDYYPPGSSPKEGDLAPDVVVTLDLTGWKESGLPWATTTEAAVRVTAGAAQLARANSSYQDSLTPPVVNFAWEGTLSHRSTAKGVASSAAKYKQVAEHCAKQIGDALAKQFDGDLKKYGPLPKLPAGFYPPYRAPQGVPLADTYPMEPMVSWHGLMNHCDTTWRLTTDREPGEILGELRKRWESAGWKTSESFNQPHLTHVRMTRGPAVVEIFPEKQSTFSAGPPPSVVDDKSATQPRPRHVVYIRYLDRMDQKQLAAAIDQAVAENVSVDLLVLFEHSWTQAQSGQILAQMEAQRPKDADGWLTLAHLYQRLGQTPKAREAVIRANALQRVSPDKSGLPERVAAMAKSLGDESLAKRAPDAGLLKELGFVEIRPGAAIPDQEIGVGESACFLASDRNAKLHTIAIRIDGASSAGGNLPPLTFVDCSDGSQSWGTCGSEYSRQIEGLGMVRITATPLADGRRFRISARVTPSSPAPVAATR